MRKNVTILRVFAAMLLSVGLASCERANVSAPSDLDAQFSNNGKSRVKSRQVQRATAVSGETATDYLTHNDSGELSITGTNAAGEAFAHTLTIPSRSVQQRTRFTMSLQGTQDAFFFELTATKQGSRQSNDVGRRGFLQPLTLCLAKADAQITDETKVSIAEVVNGNFLKVPTTVTDTHICGELRHFSGYTMIED